MDPSYSVGDSVQICPEVQHPGLGISLAGWQGRVVDVTAAAGRTYLAMQWDSQTLREMPPGMAQYALDRDWEWRGWIFTPDQVQPAKARDTELATAVCVKEISAALRQEVHEVAEEMPGSLADMLWDDEEETFFDLPIFLAELTIPQGEHDAIAEGLAVGAGTYYRQQYGHWRYGKRPFFLIPSLMAKAPIFGYGALAVLADERISLESRHKIAYFACQTTDPFARNHVPYGLISFISFLADHGALSRDLFRSVLLALELSGSPDKLASWSVTEAHALTAWLVAEKAMPPAEKLWWLWYLSAHLPTGLGKTLLPLWISHPGLPLDLRRELAWGWLMGEEQLGEPPANWRLMAATFAGDVEQAEVIAHEMNLEAATAVAGQGVWEDLLRTPHIPPMPDHHGPGNDPVGFLAMLMSMRFGMPLQHPPGVRRFAVQALAELEGNPLELFQMVLAEADERNEVLRQGVLDTLPAYGDRLTAEQKRHLLNMGLIVGKVGLRQRIYELGVQWLGDEYVQEALVDPAPSIRNWAMAQQAKNANLTKNHSDHEQ